MIFHLPVRPWFLPLHNLKRSSFILNFILIGINIGSGNIHKATTLVDMHRSTLLITTLKIMTPSSAHPLRCILTISSTLYKITTMN